MNAADPTPTPRRSFLRRRRTLSLVVAAFVGVAALALGTTGALSGFTAQIQNTTNTITSGSLSMQEDQLTSLTNTTVLNTCNSVPGSTTACSTINKFGGAAAAKPGTTYPTVVRITNTGSTSANTFSLTPSACAQTHVGDAGYDQSFCGKVRITIEDDTTTPTCLVPATSSACTSGGDTDGMSLTTFNTTYGGSGLPLTGPVAASAARTFTITAWVSVGASGNTDQGIQASQPLLWTFNGNG